MHDTTTLQGHRSLGATLRLRRQRARGHHLQVIEIVQLPDDPTDATEAELVTAQQAAEQRGQCGDATVGLLVEMWANRHIPPHRLAREHAMGRLTSFTEQVKVWEVYRVTNGQLRRAASDQDSLDQAVATWLRSTR